MGTGKLRRRVTLSCVLSSSDPCCAAAAESASAAAVGVLPALSPDDQLLPSKASAKALAGLACRNAGVLGCCCCGCLPAPAAPALLVLHTNCPKPPCCRSCCCCTAGACTALPTTATSAVLLAELEDDSRRSRPPSQPPLLLQPLLRSRLYLGCCRVPGCGALGDCRRCCWWWRESVLGSLSYTCLVTERQQQAGRQAARHKHASRHRVHNTLARHDTPTDRMCVRQEARRW